MTIPAPQDVRRRPTGWRWSQIGAYAFLHATALLAPWHFSWSGLLLLLSLLWLCGGLGISLGWHRLNTHRSFKTSRALRAVLTMLGCCSWQGGPVEWVGTHRTHHRQTDRPQLDPHTPREGVFWAHAEWMFYRLPYDPYVLTKDLLRLPEFRMLEKTWWLFAWGVLGVLYLAGNWHGGVGLSWLLWGGSLRSVVVLHATWFVNSAGHRWGYRNFETPDDSTNNAWVALVSFGEGWHNNHHAYQASAAHGMFRGEPDATYETIRVFERLGLVWDVIVPPARLIQRRTRRSRSASTRIG